MTKNIDLTGQKFGRLTVVKKVVYTEGIRAKKTFWFCKCDCGKNAFVDTYSLKNNSTKSCGCYKRELFIKNFPRRPIHIVNFKTGEVR